MPALSHLCDDTREDWGAAPSRGVNFVDLSEKADFLTHHDGAARLHLADKSHDACLERVRAVQRFHMGPSRGWDDIGYNTLLCPHGRLIEGRGVLAVGAQCPGHNRSGIGSQLMVGGSDPNPARMLNRQRKFYDTLVGLRGSSMRKMGHRDGVATECPGDELEKWVKAGMPIIGGTGGHTAPIPAPKPQPAPKPSSGLVVDGKLGPATIKRWQKVMGTEADGVISRPSELVRAVQRHLNAKGARLVVDGKGIGSNNGGDYGPTATVKALQRYLGTTADGVLSHPTSEAVKALQRRLNSGRF